jgi:hypothetical protein
VLLDEEYIDCSKEQEVKKKRHSITIFKKPLEILHNWYKRFSIQSHSNSKQSIVSLHNGHADAGKWKYRNMSQVLTISVVALWQILPLLGLQISVNDISDKKMAANSQNEPSE